jgi:hypothetical protein
MGSGGTSQRELLGKKTPTYGRARRTPLKAAAMRDPLAISDQDRTNAKHTRAGARAVLDGRIAFQSPRARHRVGRLGRWVGRLGRCDDWLTQFPARCHGESARSSRSSPGRTRRLEAFGPTPWGACGGRSPPSRWLRWKWWHHVGRHDAQVSQFGRAPRAWVASSQR